jgi:hypothetical protein
MTRQDAKLFYGALSPKGAKNPNGMLQHILQGHAVGPTPLQWPFDKAFPQAYSELNIVLDQVTQERMQCPEFLKFAKDQPDHMLDLGIRIVDDLAGALWTYPIGSAKLSAPRRAFCKVP